MRPASNHNRSHFNPRPSREGRPLSLTRHNPPVIDFNPRPSREGRRVWAFTGGTYAAISIHAPRGRGDWRNDLKEKGLLSFQSTPLAGGATKAKYMDRASELFQSTPLAGGATWRY